jgi:hypothetical protein
MACQKEKKLFDIKEFNPITNWQEPNTEKLILLDYTHAIDSGFVIPSVRQVSDGMFHFEFSIKNLSGKAQPFYYKIFYQNESYKYPLEYTDEVMNPLASENFYGSWEETTTGFMATAAIPADGQFHKVRSSFRIVGNPRDEVEFYGTERIEKPFTGYQMEVMKKEIIKNNEWMADIQRKAQQRQVSIEQQISDDAIYALKEKRRSHRFNNRWKRNPRTGTYSFLLVVTTPSEHERIPVYIKDIGIKLNHRYINPYWYFLHNRGSRLTETTVLRSNTTLTVKAKPNLANGIFINQPFLETLGTLFDYSQMRNDCNFDSANYVNAHFSQYFHHIMAQMRFKNIPVIEDVTTGNVSLDDYRNYLKRYNPNNMIDAAIANADCPCRDVRYDSTKTAISISNPSTQTGKWNKTNVGIISRNGFTYGRFTARIKFTELLNKNHVWNGITNAFWMLNESNDEWNKVRACNKKGYIPKGQEGEFAERIMTTSYSEIDIEIRKASPVWPITSYNPGHTRPPYDGNDWENIIVTCTNWDLACEQPKRFTSGTQNTFYNGEKFLLHRWNPWYQALTTKYSVNDDSLNKRDYYYYQIEWKPDTIIWRIGPEKDQLKTICFLDAKTSMIPNNQMLMVITQEYHPSLWWPESPQLLEYIPFPKNPITGYVLDIEIE